MAYRVILILIGRQILKEIEKYVVTSDIYREYPLRHHLLKNFPQV